MPSRGEVATNMGKTRKKWFVFTVTKIYDSTALQYVHTKVLLLLRCTHSKCIWSRRALTWSKLNLCVIRSLSSRDLCGPGEVVPRDDEDVVRQLNRLEQHDDGHPQVEAERSSHRREAGLELLVKKREIKTQGEGGKATDPPPKKMTNLA